MTDQLERLARLRDGRSRRISSYQRAGGNSDYVKLDPGETVDIARIDGAGVIKHIWVTFGSKDPMRYRNIILRMYWDGEERPSVESPIGDFFGQGWSEEYTYVALPLCVAPTRALNSYFAMPFSDGARVEIENDSEHPIEAFYYYVDYEERDAIDDDMGRFHAQWKRRLNVPPERHESEWRSFGPQAPNLTDQFNHPFIEAEGRGHYVGLNYYVDCPTPMWYGEGDDMFFIDGEAWPPSMHGTGTEDYFNSSYCPKTYYCHPYFGYARVNGETGFLGRTHCYRFHVEDPIIFNQSIRGSIEVGHANSLTVDLVTVAYWYQTEPHTPFGGLADRTGRENMPKIDLTHIHKWREAWRQAMGGGPLWGHEPLPESFIEDLHRQAAEGRKAMTPPENVETAKREQAAQEQMLNRRRRDRGPADRGANC